MKTCPAPLAYREMSDTGPARICGCPAVTPAGFCRRHDPETKPKRDGRAGRIIPKFGRTIILQGGYVFDVTHQHAEHLNVLEHRANAYPKLVEALKAMCAARDDGTDACALLRSLGEAA